MPESMEFLFVESGILGFGIRNTAQGIRNPANDWNPESKFHCLRIFESSIWNPESKTVLVSLYMRQMFRFVHVVRKKFQNCFPATEYSNK